VWVLNLHPTPEASMHGNARLTPLGRATLIERIQQGRPVAHVAAEMGISRPTAYKWWARFRADGWVGLEDRSSRPVSCPHRTPRRVERRIEQLRRARKLGPARIGPIVGVAPSTVHRVLVRAGLNRLTWMDRPSGRVIRQIRTDRPGERVHVDVKKLGRIPTGGGWRAWGRAATVDHRHKRTPIGFVYVHSAVDAYTRLAYSEILDDERAPSCAEFWTRAAAWFAELGITIEEVRTDNAWAYDSPRFQAALGTARHTKIRPHHPEQNGKVERFNRTLANEWAYVRIYRSDTARTRALDRWLHHYNHHRAHTALSGQPPISRVNDLPGHYT
jgi:transposase InsO family protein